MDDPGSEISRVLAKNNVTVRKPEQGTAPKLFYIEGNELALHPTAIEQGSSFMFAEVQERHGIEGEPHSVDFSTQGLPFGGPIQVGGNMAEHMVQVAYNAQHPVHWHWPIPAYLITKHIAGGSFAFLSLMALVDGFVWPELMVFGGGLGLLMLAITLGLLVYDLDRPDRFLYLLARPQWRSWVARAAWLLTGFSMVAGLWWSIGFASISTPVRFGFALVCLPLSVLSAVYTAFLFAQAEGRDFWQSAHLPIQMGLHALAFGLLTMMTVTEFLVGPGVAVGVGESLAALALVSSLIVTIVGDLWIPHATEVARATAERMAHGPYRLLYWFGGIAMGHFLPMFLMVMPAPFTSVIALISASLGLFFYNYALVMAPQDIPNS